jgi:hypothetical protein
MSVAIIEGVRETHGAINRFDDNAETNTERPSNSG